MNRRGFLLGALAATTSLTGPSLLVDGPRDRSVVWAVVTDESLWSSMMEEGAKIARVEGAHTASVAPWAGIVWYEHGGEVA